MNSSIKQDVASKKVKRYEGRNSQQTQKVLVLLTTLHVTLKKSNMLYYSLYLVFSLAKHSKQRVVDNLSGLGESFIPIMTNIADLFQCKINFKSTNEMTFVVQAHNKHNLVTFYFDKYCLMSSKYLDYLCYVKGLNYLGKRLSAQEIDEVQKIKNSMNDKRTYLSWDHLDT